MRYIEKEREGERERKWKRGKERKEKRNMQEILLQVAFYFAGKLFVVVVVVCSCYVADVTGLRADKRYICIYTSMYVYIVDSSTHTALGEARYVVALTRLRFTQRRWQVACCCCCSCTLQRRPRSSQAARP